MNKTLIAFLTVLLFSGATQAQQFNSDSIVRPLYKMDEVETIQPDSGYDNTKTAQVLPEFMINNLHFQLADPKGIYYADPKKEIELRKAIDLKQAQERKRLAELKRQEEAKKKAEEEKRLAELKKQEEAKKRAEEEKRLAELKRQEEAKKKAEEEKRLAELKRQEEAKKKAEEEKRLAELKKQEEAEKKAEEEKRLTELKKQEEAKKRADEEKRLTELKKQEEAKKRADEEKRLAELKKQEEAKKRTEEEKRLAELKKQEEAKKRADEEKRLAENKKQEDEEVFFTKEEIKETYVTKDTGYNVENLSLRTDIQDEKLRITPPDEKPTRNEYQTEEPKKEIDYYLQKYSSTLEGGANKDNYNHSLMTPFRDSFFYKVLKDNRSEDIELKTVDVTSDSRPEAVVSYNAPQGADGEYACQVLVLKPEGSSLAKLWISELIPGEIDTVYTQDINNDGQNDIAVISTTGGVSLLKSIRVYSYDKSRSSFDTIFAMNGIMEGLVDIRNGKVLVSETFPGGVNRAALYMWNGRRFERLEL